MGVPAAPPRRVFAPRRAGAIVPAGGNALDRIEKIDKFVGPFGGQQVELQQVEYEAGGMPLLRLRIRERGARFTIFEIDAATAERWATAMQAWASRQARA